MSYLLTYLLTYDYDTRLLPSRINVKDQPPVSVCSSYS